MITSACLTAIVMLIWYLICRARKWETKGAGMRSEQPHKPLTDEEAAGDLHMANRAQVTAVQNDETQGQLRRRTL